MTRDQLWVQLRRAHAMGWRVSKGELPEVLRAPFFPNHENIFKPLELLSPAEVKFLILGRDPYYDTKKDSSDPIATGMAFAVESLGDVKPSCPIHKVLKGIYGEDEHRRQNSNLEAWAKSKGVLLLNAALTVRQGPENQRNKYAGGHLDFWRPFVATIIRQVVREERGDVVTVAWGSTAFDLLNEVLGRKPDLASNYPAASGGKLGNFSQFWATPAAKPCCA